MTRSTSRLRRSRATAGATTGTLAFTVVAKEPGLTIERVNPDSFEVVGFGNAQIIFRLAGSGFNDGSKVLIYGQAVELMEAEEGAAYGVAILAGVAARAWPNVEAACDEVIRTRDRVEPNPDAVKVLDRQYRSYVAIYPALRSVFTT